MHFHLATPPSALGLALPAAGLATVADGLAAPEVEAHTDAMSNALALARTLMPTAPPSTVQYNLLVVDVQRYGVNYLYYFTCTIVGS